jgi:hypothetical protein
MIFQYASYIMTYTNILGKPQTDSLPIKSTMY